MLITLSRYTLKTKITKRKYVFYGCQAAKVITTQSFMECLRAPGKNVFAFIAYQLIYIEKNNIAHIHTLIFVAITGQLYG